MIYQFRGGLREDLQLALVFVDLLSLTNSIIWPSSKKVLSSSVRLLRRESGMQFSLLLPLKGQLSSKSSTFLLLCFVSLTNRRTQVVVDLPTHPTQAIRTSLSLKLQGQMLCIIVRSQRWLATSASRKVTTRTSALTKGAFLLLL